jgi:hypothetical protein
LDLKQEIQIQIQIFLHLYLLQRCGYIFQDTRQLEFSLAKPKNNWPQCKIEFSLAKPKTTGPKCKKGYGDYFKKSPGWQVDFYFCSPILNFTHIWRVGEWLSAPLLL